MFSLLIGIVLSAPSVVAAETSAPVEQKAMEAPVLIDQKEIVADREKIELFRESTGELLWSKQFGISSLIATAYCPERDLVAYCQRGVITICDGKTGREKDHFLWYGLAENDGEEYIKDLIFDPEGKRLVAVGSSVIVYDLSERKCAFTITSPGEQFCAVIFSSKDDIDLWLDRTSRLIARCNLYSKRIYYMSRTGNWDPGTYYRNSIFGPKDRYSIVKEFQD